MNKEKIKHKIYNLWACDIYKQTIEEANKYTFGGRAITYIDAINGNIGTYWLLQNTYSHDPYEIVLCSIETPLDIPSDDFFESKEEQQRFFKSELSLEEFLGDKYATRLEIIFDEWSYDFELDYKYIEEQLEKQFVNLQDAGDVLKLGGFDYEGGNFIGTKKIHWEYEGKTYTGTVTFTQDGSNIQVTASSDQSTQTFYNEVHSIEDAQIIYDRLAENDWNSEDIL